jgi:hypothetical protein
MKSPMSFSTPGVSEYDDLEAPYCEEGLLHQTNVLFSSITARGMP